MKDIQIVCIQCNNTFSFSSREQELYRSRGFDAPKHCPECRENKQKALHKSERRKQDHRQRRGRRDADRDYW